MQGFIRYLLHHGFEAFNKYYSSYRGYVVDNEDPENCNRLKIVVPQITQSEPLPNWALPFGIPAGLNWGSHALPKVGELVWVQFEMGNPKYPLWTYSYFGRNEKPQMFTTDKQYGFKTPDGHTVMYEDDEENPHITIKHSNELKIVIDKEGVSLVLNGDRKIFLGSLDQAAEFILKGETTKLMLEKEKARVDRIIQAIEQADTGSSDGGAMYKTQMRMILFGIEAADYSGILSDKVKTD
jgi:hypothetical protein